MKLHGALGARWSRLNGPERIAGVDLARGLAVLGMLAAHLLVTAPEWSWTDSASWLSIVDGRSSILFALLAGVSIGLVTGGREVRASQLVGAMGRLAVRAGILWLLGILLVLTGVPVYVILPAYGILFLLALPFTPLRARTVLAAAAVIGIVAPFVQPLVEALPIWADPGGAEVAVLLGWHYPFTVWITFLLVGLGVARSGIDRRSTQWRMLGAGAGAAVIGYGGAALFPAGNDYLAQALSAAPHSSGLGEVVGSCGFALALLAGCLLLCTRRGMTPLGWVALPLRAVGSMPLTAYTAQLLVWAVAASALLGDAGDLAGFRALAPFWPLTIGIVFFCTAWALLVGRGPLEWASDRLTRVLVRG